MTKIISGPFCTYYQTHVIGRNACFIFLW